MSLRVPMVLLALALAAPASASTLEQATFGLASYQFDGGTHHDAPDACAAAHPAWSLTLGASTDGVLVAPDDLADAYVLDAPRGGRVQVALSQPAGMPDLALDLLAPGCAGSVLDVANWPTPEPSPPAPGTGEMQHEADVSAPWRCEDDGRLFVLTRTRAVAAPESIHLAWTDGTEGPVALQGQYGDLAVYTSAERLGILLKGAWANLPSTWDGSFLYAAGPCDAVDGGAVYGDPPTLSDGVLSFTAVHAGAHVLLVTFAGAPLAVPDLTVGTGSLSVESSLAGLAAFDPTAPRVPALVVPASCHACAPQVEEAVARVSYLISAKAA